MKSKDELMSPIMIPERLIDYSLLSNEVEKELIDTKEANIIVWARGRPIGTVERIGNINSRGAFVNTLGIHVTVRNDDNLEKLERIVREYAKDLIDLGYNVEIRDKFCLKVRV